MHLRTAGLIIIPIAAFKDQDLVLLMVSLLAETVWVQNEDSVGKKIHAHVYRKQNIWTIISHRLKTAAMEDGSQSSPPRT